MCCNAPEENPDGSIYWQWAWSELDGFVDRFNKHRATKYSPSARICIDESMSKWYGLGRNWINMGLPMDVTMERKLKDGCEIQTCCDGVSRSNNTQSQVSQGKECRAGRRYWRKFRYGASLYKVILDLLNPCLKALEPPRLTSCSCWFLLWRPSYISIL